MKRVTPRSKSKQPTDSDREQNSIGISHRDLSQERREQAELPPRGQRKDSEKPTPEQHKPRQPELEDENEFELEDESAAQTARERDETD